MPGVLLRDGVRRDGFIATLDARTWRPRAHAASALAQLDAVGSRGAYAGWLRRVAGAWSHLPRPAVAPHADAVHWPLACVDAAAVDLWPALLADLRDLAPVTRGDAPVAAPRHRGHTDPLPASPVDEAFLVGAAHVAVVTAADAAVLADAVLALASTASGPVGTRFVRECRRLAPVRWPLRHELAAWAAAHGPAAADRAVLTARALTLDVAQALTGSRPGW